MQNMFHAHVSDFIVIYYMRHYSLLKVQQPLWYLILFIRRALNISATECASNNLLQGHDVFYARRRLQIDVCMQKRNTRTLMEDFNTETGFNNSKF